MISQKRKNEICKSLNSIPVNLFEDYLISKEGKLYHLDSETGNCTDISKIISHYTKKGVPVYRLIDLKDKDKILEIRLDKLVLNAYVGDLDGKIIHKDHDYNNCTIDNLKYELDVDETYDNTLLYVNGREFKLINIENNRDYYMSDNGIVYDNYNRNLRTLLTDKDLYYSVSILSSKHRLHRLVYSTWIAEIIPKELTVNHKDGNKRNNHYTNLELMTIQENTSHAHLNNLNPITRWDKNDIRKMCELLEQNLPSNDICEHLNVTDKKERRELFNLLTTIRRGDLHKDISSQYKIDKRFPTTQTRKLSSEQVHTICELLQDGFLDKKIAELTGLKLHYIRSIKDGHGYKEISSQYDFSKYYILNTYGTLSYEQVVEICELLDSGVNIHEISNKLNISLHIIKNIRRGETYTNITKNYNFYKNYNSFRVSKEKIHEVCQLIDKNLKNVEISKLSGVSLGIISSIRNGKYHIDISNQYNFMNKNLFQKAA